MADPALRMIKGQEYERRLWIGGLDGVLKGLEKARGSSKEQIEIASRQIVELIFKERQIGLKAFQNRIQLLPEAQETGMTKPDDWKKSGQNYDLVRHTFQEWRKLMKKHVKSKGDLDTYVWPDPPEQSEPVLQDLLEFEKKFLQGTAVGDWYTVDSANATHPDAKFTLGIIKAFWLGKDIYPIWLAHPDVWRVRQDFGQILNNAAGDMFTFPDDIGEPNWASEYAEAPDHELEDEQHDGFHGKLNKHLLDDELHTLRNQQTQTITKLVKLVSEFGSVKDGNEAYLPPKLSKQLNGLLLVRKTLLVAIYVLC
jgi:hypothetical protein